jgi:septal ring factor EnvC (AmiA/AmiB activator)
MDKPLKIVVYVVLGLVVFHLVFDLFNTRSNIKAVIENLKKSRQNIDSALNEIKFSQGKLKEMQEDLNKFSLYINDIQRRVELDDNEKKKLDAMSIRERDSLKTLIKKGKEEILKSDSLPPIAIKDLN